MKSQKGSLDLNLIVALVLVLAVAGFAFMRINQADEIVKDQEATFSNSQIDQISLDDSREDEEANEDSDTQEDTTVPEGWAVHVIDEVGVSFMHPETWGKPVPTIYDGITGTDLSITFSDNENVVVGSKSVDLTHGGRGGAWSDTYESYESWRILEGIVQTAVWDTQNNNRKSWIDSETSDVLMTDSGLDIAFFASYPPNDFLGTQTHFGAGLKTQNETYPSFGMSMKDGNESDEAIFKQVAQSLSLN